MLIKPHAAIVLASSNVGKLHEIQHYLQNLSISVLPQSQFNITDVEETQTTFVENALLKARHASKIAGLPALADDSGLEVDALNEAPGIFSARYAGEPSNAENNNKKLLNALKNVPAAERTARFQCVIVLLQSPEDPTPLICQGTWEGRVLLAPQGAAGFGYDPLFYVPTHACSAAELPLNVKNQISHRAQALHQLRDSLLLAASTI